MKPTEQAKAYVKLKNDQCNGLLSDGEKLAIQFAYLAGFNEALSQMQPEWPWVVIDINDADTFPLEFDRVLCLTVTDEYQVLHMLKYSDTHREWETGDLKRNEAFSFEYVKQWKNINEPPTDKP